MKNYVSKLIDRNLQKKRESGITSYVLYSVLILVFYKLTQLYSVIPFKKDFWDVFIIFTTTLNICLGLFFIISIYFETTKHTSSIRIKLNNNKRNLLDELLIILVIFLPFGFSSLLAYHDYFYLNTSNWYSIIISILEFIFFIITFSLLKYERKNRNKIEITEGSTLTNDDRNWFSVTVYLLGAFIIIYSIINLHCVNSNIPKLNILIFSILFYSVFFIVLKIFQLKESDNFINALEKFEYEINMKNLSDNDIRIELQKNYFGFLISDWIKYNYDLINSFENETDKEFAYLIDESVADLQKRAHEFSQKNKSSISFIEQNKNSNILKLEKDIINKKNRFYYSKLKEIEGFYDNSEIEGDQKIELTHLRETLIEKIKQINKSH
ncbi:conserved membrane hypothetical protein [Flavobacterium sp. 9AF]|uniref:hypothetical protein n=1 Tax=Flavobacterium sp. 9AF TaxID=2653142 RepID=UPI0012F2D917|nr:hypothetical protein [Flavobacterium sp. 9AF]VXB79753.1 conserved membrane hypothetical protein [Flavobacterium sp. 9AF]